MSCCGQNRRQQTPTARRSGQRQVHDRAGAFARGPSSLYFQYVGRTAMRVIGPASGRGYRFQRPGAIVAVDRRDLMALRAVPQLMQVAAPY